MPKLLIVDDEKDITEFARRFFVKRGIDVMTASGGNQALQIIDADKPDLVLLDVQMEEMTGIDVLEKLRSSGNNVKVIMVTGNESEEIMTRAKEFGVREYIHKPLILDELEKIVLSEINA